MDEREHRLMGIKEVAVDEDLYVIVDFLNRVLKEKDVIVGLTKSRDSGKYQISVYRAD